MSFSITQQEIFIETSRQLLSLALNGEEKSKNDCFKVELNRLLDILNSLDFASTKLVENEAELIGDDVLCRCCVLLTSSSDSDHLVTKFCPLVVNLVRKQQLQLSSETLSVLVSFLSKSLERCNRFVHPYILQSLSTLFYGNSARITEFLDYLVGPKGVLLTLSTDEDDETNRCSFKCLENLTLRTSTSGNYLTDDQIQRCLLLFFDRLQTSCSASKLQDIVHSKILVSCLVGIQNVIVGGRMNDIPILGELLAILKCLMFFSLPGHSNLSTVSCLYPSPLSLSVLSDERNEGGSSTSPGSKHHAFKTRKKRIVNKRERTNVRMSGDDGHRSSDGEGGSPSRRHDTTANYFSPSWSKASSSESEYSDSEGGSTVRLRTTQSKVRQCAMATLAAVFKMIDRKVGFGYWSSFLPDSPTSINTLISSILKDPAPKVRSGALTVLNTMLEGSKQFLSLADDRDASKMAFTTISATLASNVRELHRNLILALVSETSPLVLTQVVKCVTTLIQNAPVHKLASGFLTKFVRHLRPLLVHRDSNVCVAVLTCFGAILYVQSPLAEVSHLLRGESTSQSVEKTDDNDKSQVPLQSRLNSTCWLLDVCIYNSSTNKAIAPLPIRLESLQVLAALTRAYYGFVHGNLSSVIAVIREGLGDGNKSVRLHCAKLLEELGRSVVSTDDKTPSLSTEEVADIWSSLLGTSLTVVMQDHGYSFVQAKGCDCLSTISSEVFAALPVRMKLHQQILCQTLLLGLAHDEEKVLKAAATRALGVFVLHSSLREDSAFVVDVSECVIAAMNDPNIEVRLKAAWALANVTDALVLNRGSQVEDDVPEDLLMRISNVAHKAATDNDRVRSNGVRALGNLLRYLGPSVVSKDDFRTMVQTSIDTLIKCASVGSNMKVRWNACYALGNTFRNSDVTTAFASSCVSVLSSLSLLAKDCKNFKVRINATAVIAIPSDRSAYGETKQLAAICENLLGGLENIQTSMSFVEYQHKDNLVDQLCFTLLHMIALLDASDFETVDSIVDPFRQTLKSYLYRCLSSNRDADKSSELRECHQRALSHLSKQMEVKTDPFTRNLLTTFTVDDA